VVVQRRIEVPADSGFALKNICGLISFRIKWLGKCT
jgi:hypothetical protein